MELPEYTYKEAGAIARSASPDLQLAAVAASSGFYILIVVGGQLYSGRTATRDEWIEAMKQNNTPDTFIQGFQKHNDDPTLPDEVTALESDNRSESEIAAEIRKSIRRYLYLLDCSFSSSGTTVALNGAAMRFRLSEVQGWSFGALTESRS